MSTSIETKCAEAMARVMSHINRSAGQHSRAIKRAFVAAQNRVHDTESIGYERTTSGIVYLNPIKTTPTHPEA